MNDDWRVCDSLFVGVDSKLILYSMRHTAVEVMVVGVVGEHVRMVVSLRRRRRRRSMAKVLNEIDIRVGEIRSMQRTTKSILALLHLYDDGRLSIFTFTFTWTRLTTATIRIVANVIITAATAAMTITTMNAVVLQRTE